MDGEATLKSKDPVLCESLSDGNAESCEQASKIDCEISESQGSAVSNGGDSDEGKEMVDLKIIWNKNKYDLKIPLDGTGGNLKERIHSLTGKGLYTTSLIILTAT